MDEDKTLGEIGIELYEKVRNGNLSNSWEIIEGMRTRDHLDPELYEDENPNLKVKDIKEYTIVCKDTLEYYFKVRRV